MSGPIRRGLRALFASAALVALVAACGGPLGPFPGGALEGEERPAPADWSFARAYSALDLETRPSDPRSVRISFVERGGRLYIEGSLGRHWLRQLMADPNVRVRIGGDIYRAVAIRVTNSDELEGFPSDAFVFRLAPRR